MSDNYISLYRKWRSQDLEQIIGQDFTVRTLTNALKNQKIAHAYLFCGPRGTGKTSFARILAKSVNCQEGITPSPCQVCKSCVSIKDGTSLDVIEIDAASNRGVDDIRELREKVKFAPVVSRYKVYIIDEVHMLTDEAFNALLKTLEEPPPHIIFILATTEPHKIPVTITSRCMRFDLKRIPIPNQVQLLRKISDAEKIDISDESLRMIAIESNGSLRDAESMLDQIASFSEGRIEVDHVSSMLGTTGERLLHELVMAVANKNALQTINITREAFKNGKEPEQISKDLLARFHILMLVAIGYSKQDLASDYAVNMGLIEDEAQSFQFERLRWVENRLRELVSQMRYAFSALGSLELALLDLIDNNQWMQSEEKVVQKHAAAAPKQTSQTKSVEPIVTHSTQATSPKIEPKPTEQTVQLSANPEKEKKEPITNQDRQSTQAPFAAPSGDVDKYKQIAKENDIIVYAFLSRLISIESSGDNLTLTFPSDAEFEKARLTEPANLQKLAKFAGIMFDRETSVQIKLSKVESKNILEDEQVQMAKNLFGGKTEVN